MRCVFRRTLAFSWGLTVSGRDTLGAVGQKLSTRARGYVNVFFALDEAREAFGSMSVSVAWGSTAAA